GTCRRKRRGSAAAAPNGPTAPWPRGRRGRFRYRRAPTPTAAWIRACAGQGAAIRENDVGDRVRERGIDGDIHVRPLVPGELLLKRRLQQADHLAVDVIDRGRRKEQRYDDPAHSSDLYRRRFCRRLFHKAPRHINSPSSLPVQGAPRLAVVRETGVSDNRRKA